MSLLTADVKPINDAKSINRGVRYVMANVVITALTSIFLGISLEGLREQQHDIFQPYSTVIWAVLAIFLVMRTHRWIKRLASSNLEIP